MHTPSHGNRRSHSTVLGVLALAALLFAAGCIVVPAHPHHYRAYQCQQPCR